MNHPKNEVPRYFKRPMVIMAGVVIGAATLIFANQTWVEVFPTGQIVQTSHILVSGADVSALVSALALVTLAGSAALSIADKWAARIVGVLVALSGVANIVTIFSAMGNVENASSTAVSEATGVPTVTGEYVLTAAPTISLVLSGIIVCLGIWILLAHRWWKRQRKYDVATAESKTDEDQPLKRGTHLDEIDAWDALSASEDPTIK